MGGLSARGAESVRSYGGARGPGHHVRGVEGARGVLCRERAEQYPVIGV